METIIQKEKHIFHIFANISEIIREFEKVLDTKFNKRDIFRKNYSE